MRRAYFVDFGRWTVGRWRGTRRGTIFAVGFVRRDKPCGLEVALGRYVVGFFSLCSRAEHAAREERARRGAVR